VVGNRVLNGARRRGRGCLSPSGWTGSCPGKPETFTLDGGSTNELDYDGDQNRIRKTGGLKLSGGGKKVLRDPALQAMKDKTLREGILDRGGGGGVVRKAGDLADRTIAEVANAAAQGDEASVKAIKLLKDAARLGGKNHGQ
jgi:hypothetical protein